MTIVQDLRESFKSYKPSTVFSYGRPADAAIASAKLEVDDWFVHLNPVTVNGTSPDSNLNSPITLGVLRQDRPDSEYDNENELAITDSIEKIQADAQDFILNWLNYHLDNYGKKYGVATYTISPATRLMNVMSGILFNVTFTYKGPC